MAAAIDNSYPTDPRTHEIAILRERLRRLIASIAVKTRPFRCGGACVRIVVGDADRMIVFAFPPVLRKFSSVRSVPAARLFVVLLARYPGAPA